MIEDLLDDYNRQMEKLLLDLYLTEGFAHDILIERKQRLQTTIDALEQEQADLTTQLETQTLTDEQIQAFIEFSAKMGYGLEEAKENFEAQRQIIEFLDVRGVLAIEEGEKVIYAQCRIVRNPKRLLVVPTSVGIRGGARSLPLPGQAIASSRPTSADTTSAKSPPAYRAIGSTSSPPTSGNWSTPSIASGLSS